MPQTEHCQPIYLDNNATTALLPEVADAMLEAAQRFAANPASQHRAGQSARRALEQARERISTLLGAKNTGLDADRMIFTSGGTEANNLAILGMLAGQLPGHFITSAIEHPSVLGLADELERRGWRVSRVRAKESGVIDIDELAADFCKDTRLVSIMAANSETGVIQPVEQVSEICVTRGVRFHSDAAQWIGKQPSHFREWDLAALSIAAHKFHGPVGIGGLLLRNDTIVSPLLHGGHQQEGSRPGTESVPLAIGMCVALEKAHQGIASYTERMGALRGEFESRILEAIAEAIVIGHSSPRVPNTSNISFPGVDRQALFLALDMAGVACSTGAACASGSSEPSPALLAMGLKRELVESSLRFSFGHLNTAEEARDAARRIINAYKQLHR